MQQLVDQLMSITEITNEEAAILGDAAKELYYETNKTDEGKQFLSVRLQRMGR